MSEGKKRHIQDEYIERYRCYASEPYLLSPYHCDNKNNIIIIIIIIILAAHKIFKVLVWIKVSDS